MPFTHGPRQTVSPSTQLGQAELNYAQLGRLGLTSWQRHATAIAVILFFWLVVGAAATLAVAFLEPGSLDLAHPSLAGYLAVNASLVSLLAGVLIAVRVIHQRPVRSLITPSRAIDPHRIAAAFGLTLVLAGISTTIDAWLNPGNYHLSFQPGRWLPLLPVILVVTTLQTSAEELLFRGYALQALGLLTRSTWILVAVSGFLFAVPHLANPEMAAGSTLVTAFYFCFGASLAFITLRDNRLELALGAHAANNLFAALVVNHMQSSLPTRAIWQTDVIDPAYNLISFLLSAALFYWLLVRRPRSAAAGSPARSPRPRPHRGPDLTLDLGSKTTEVHE